MRGTSWAFGLVFAMAVGCRSKGDGGAGTSASASATLGPLTLDDLPKVVTDPSCTRNDAAKVSADLETALASLPSPIAEKVRRRFGFDCGKTSSRRATATTARRGGSPSCTRRKRRRSLRAPRSPASGARRTPSLPTRISARASCAC